MALRIRNFALCVWLLVAGMLPAVGAPVPQPMLRVDEGARADGQAGGGEGVGISALRIAGRGSGQLALGWIEGEGSGARLNLRTRINWNWQPTLVVSQGIGESPRDLVLEIDQAGRLHAAWTALVNGQRRLLLGTLGMVGDGAWGIREISPGTRVADDEASAPSDVDFPTLVATPEGGLVLVWQESRGLRMTVRAARLEAGGTISDLGLVSGRSSSGMSPQIVRALPLTVAWYEIFPIGSELRIEEWNPIEGRWHPALHEALIAEFPVNRPLLLKGIGGGLLGAWETDQPRSGYGMVVGTSRVDFSMLPNTLRGIVNEYPVRVPVGDMHDPVLAGDYPGRVTLAWQTFDGLQHGISLIDPINDGMAAPPLLISPPEHRFAAMPDLVTQGDWSAIAWTDDLRDGGNGGIFMREINWPALGKH